eukprot:TRINITY_DN6226_c0_g1_i1.p1 TRINITY_DN6226_c0_g1~~TRINITY_DN6226_c0_g1_i1.p1  ORF type:complete len:582 (-),score=93.21 TRINITY_DN6226_c0_g1_i1:53-1798(-)
MSAGYASEGAASVPKAAPAAPALEGVIKTLKEHGDQQTYPRVGQDATLHYIGYLATTRQKFDSSLDRGSPLKFRLGARSVIRGLEEAVLGMSVGERSVLYIPAHLGYGSRESGPIPANSDLIFDIQLLSAKDPPANENEPKFQNSSRGGSLDFFVYLTKVSEGVTDFSMDAFEKLLPEADLAARLTRSNNTVSPLHVVSELAEMEDPETVHSLIGKLVNAKADLTAGDRFGETPFSTVLCLLEDDEKNQDDDDDDEGLSKEDTGFLQALVSYLEHKAPINDSVAARLVHQMDRPYSSDLQPLRDRVLERLKTRVPEKRIEELRQGNELIRYMCQFFETQEGFDPKIVKKHLDAGADPGVEQHHSRSNALHFVALNAYGTYDDVFSVLSMLLERNSAAANKKDSTGFTAFGLAADYRDTASQFRCEPNPCAMLALGELLAQYDLDIVCQTIDKTNRIASLAAPAGRKLRFAEGDRVKCLVRAPGQVAWEEGTVIGLWYRENSWPASHPGAPYEVKLDIGQCVFALADSPKIVKGESERTGGCARPTKGAKRFIKQLRGETWELLDTQTGKVRPSSPPTSDSE